MRDRVIWRGKTASASITYESGLVQARYSGIVGTEAWFGIASMTAELIGAREAIVGIADMRSACIVFDAADYAARSPSCRPCEMPVVAIVAPPMLDTLRRIGWELAQASGIERAAVTLVSEAHAWALEIAADHSPGCLRLLRELLARDAALARAARCGSRPAPFGAPAGR